MKVYDVIVEYPNGAIDVVKTEVPKAKAKEVKANIKAQLAKSEFNEGYKVYVVEAKNTLRQFTCIKSKFFK